MRRKRPLRSASEHGNLKPEQQVLEDLEVEQSSVIIFFLLVRVSVPAALLHWFF